VYVCVILNLSVMRDGHKCVCGCGCVGVWVCGCVGVWVCGCVCWCVGVRVCGGGSKIVQTRVTHNMYISWKP